MITLDTITELIDKNEILNFGGGICLYCGQRRGDSEVFHVDHVMPVSLGGPDVNWNKVLVCAACNQQKHNNHPLMFLKQKEREGYHVNPFTYVFVNRVLLAIQFVQTPNINKRIRENGFGEK